MLLAWGAQASENAPARAPLTISKTQELLSSGNFATIERRFSNMQTDYDNGAITDVNLRAAFEVFEPTNPALAAHYDAWISAYPRSYVAYLARGIYYENIGEESRGTNQIDETSAEQLQGMERAFRKASTDFKNSVELDPRPILAYLHAMTIARYLGDDVQARVLLDLSIKVDPRNFIVRENYMGTLEPRWGGSVERMYAFLRESRKAGLSPVQLNALKAIILADQAQIHWLAREYPAAEHDYRAAIGLGANGCLKCYADVLLEDDKDQKLIPVLSKILSKQPGDIPSLQMRAHAYWRLGKMHEALADFTTAAAFGDPYAENELGRFNATGIPEVLPANSELAISWFRKSAAQGNLAGSMELAKALKAHGIAVPQGPSSP
jgi:tetratricopeptide (TPR) repeat protein